MVVIEPWAVMEAFFGIIAKVCITEALIRANILVSDLGGVLRPPKL